MMGKARKHSRGISSGYVPDYMQAVEPDGFGYELEESPALKRSRVSLNGGSYGVSREVFSFSRMSRSERKNLVHKLRMELEQVRDLRKKIAFHSSDTILLSPYSDIHSCSDGPKRPPQENFGTFGGSQGKKKRPGRNDKQRTKKGPSRQYESARIDVPTSSTMAAVMKECEMLLNRLWSHKSGWAFRTPVDPVLLNIPDYFTVVKHPMDLGTVASRLRKDEYSSPLDFAADVRLTFSNSIAYNPPGNQYHIMAQTLSKYFESRWKSIEKKIPVIRQPVMPQTSTASLESSDTPFEVAPPRKKAAPVIERTPRVEPAKLVMTDGEKKKLSQDLEALEEEFPQNIIDLLREQSGNDGQSGEVEIEIDIDTLSDEVLFTVRKLLDDYLREKKKSQEKSEPCEMEIVHDSGFSNSPLHPSKGDPLIDEDVDIVGGNDPPVTSHPPVKIEKDAACRNNDRSGSSSSDSESGSSSSDSDSCSSSGSETDSIKASNPTITEDKMEPGVGINRKGDDVNSQKIVVNDSMNELGQAEHDVGEQSTAMDAVDVLIDEGTGPSSKRYRAALLKNRFADTILKAREKTNSKGEKGDPEKLRIEREEFEKHLKEEKMRLQAEAKAAEEAKRKAEAEAAEKVKREREQEREAARQALQKMEKTVEINEGRRFMEDLEMLRATGPEGDQLPTFMEEMIPKCSEDVLGSFNMEGNSNPLEQLGLYMKMDEDEDEDDEEDQPHLSEGEVEDHPLNRSERQALSPCGGEGEDLLVTEYEEPVSQKAQDNVNQKEGQAIDQKEGEEQMEKVSPNGEEGEDQIVRGNEGKEEPLSQKAQDNGNHEDEKLINQGEGKEESENVQEQENGVSDKGEEEAEVVNRGEEETEVPEKGEEQAVVVGLGEQENEVVDMAELETEVSDTREQETAVVSMGEQEEVVGMAEQENEFSEKGEEETVVVDKGEQETVVVNMEEQENEAVDMAERETEVSDKGEEETEVVVDMGVQGNEVVDKRGQENEIVDMAEQETEVSEKGVEETEAMDIAEPETEVSDKGEEETEVVVDMGVQENEVVDKREQENETLNMAEQDTEVPEKRVEETEVMDIAEPETEVLDKGEEDTEVVVDMGVQGNECVDMMEQETEAMDKGEEDTEVVVDMVVQETEIIEKREEETEDLDEGNKGTVVIEVQGNEVVDNEQQETEGVDLGEQEPEITDKTEEETEVVDKVEEETEVTEKGEQEATDVEERKID